MKELNEKALEYARANVKQPFYEAAIRGYVAGYCKAQSESQYHWRDPAKEKPDCCPVASQGTFFRKMCYTYEFSGS